MLVNKMFKIVIMTLIIFSISGCSKGETLPTAQIMNVVVVDDYVTFDFTLEENQEYTINSLSALVIDSSGTEVFNLTLDDILYGTSAEILVYKLNPNEEYIIQITIDYEKDDIASLNVIIDEYEFNTDEFVESLSAVVSDLDVSIDEVSFDINVEKTESVVISELIVVVVNTDEEVVYEFSDVIIGENLDLEITLLELDEDYTIYLSATYLLNGLEFNVYEELDTFYYPLWDITPVVEIDPLNLGYDELNIDLSVTENQYILITGISLNLRDSLGNNLESLYLNNGLNVGINSNLKFNDLVLNTEYHIDIVVNYTDLITGLTHTYEYDTYIFSTPNPTVTEFNQYIVQSVLGDEYTINEVTHLYSNNQIIENVYVIKNQYKHIVAYAYNIMFEGIEYDEESYIKSLVIVNLDNTFRYVYIYEDNDPFNTVNPYYLYTFGSSFDGVALNQVSYDIGSTSSNTVMYSKIMVALEELASYHLTEISMLDANEIIINGKISLTTNQLQSIFVEGQIFTEIFVDRLQSVSIKNIYHVSDESNTHIGYVFVLRIIGKEDAIEYAVGVTTLGLSNELVVLYSNETWEYAELYGNYDGSYGAFYNTVWLENFERFDLVNDSVDDIDAIAGVSVTTGSVLVSFKDIVEYYLNNLS